MSQMFIKQQILNLTLFLCYEICIFSVTHMEVTRYFKAEASVYVGKPLTPFNCIPSCLQGIALFGSV